MLTETVIRSHACPRRIRLEQRLHVTVAVTLELRDIRDRERFEEIG